MSFSYKFARALLLTSSILSSSAAMSQTVAPQATASSGVDEGAAEQSDIVVTAQKRSENLQNVPISIQAFGTKKLDELNISNFSQYAQQLPSVAFQSLFGTPGTNVIYMRGVASGGDGNSSGPLPSVGVYLDEQPVTTIGGNLDIHIYDIARIESLAGPQGTLYGASSEAGTIRIITNKPDFAGFYGRVDGEVNSLSHGGVGGKFEAMVNAPLNDKVALRLVGYYQRNAGFIDNIHGVRTFLPQPGGIIVDNAALIKKNTNDTEVAGGRAALKVDLDDNWTVTPTVVYQDTRNHGANAYDTSLGFLNVQQFFPQHRRDRFVQAALTIEGKIGNWDLTYAGAFMDRKDLQTVDYTDYSEAYDNVYAAQGGLAGYQYYQDNAGHNISSLQIATTTDHFKKMSQELRISSPQSSPLRFVGGAFYQRQTNAIHQDFFIAGLADNLSVNGHPGDIWLTQQHRVDRDYALFGEASYDILPNLTATAGVRGYKFDNSLIGFFGFGRNPTNNFTATPFNAVGAGRTGVSQCFTASGVRLRDALRADPNANSTFIPGAVAGTPCTNVGVYSNGSVHPVSTKGEGATWRFNLTWKPVTGLMVYGTASRGFRPGGINRRAGLQPYEPDYLTNFELGAKATLFDGLLRLNGAVYQQDWKHFQFTYLGENNFPENHNGPNARIRGIEVDATVTSGPFRLNTSASYTDAKTRQNLCLYQDPTYACTAPGTGGATNVTTAPKGTRLPITPRFKITSTARYTVPVGAARAYGQFTLSHQSSASTDVRLADAAQKGRLPAYSTLDLAFGADFGRFNLELFAQNALDSHGQISRYIICTECSRTYVVPINPRLIGVRAGAKF